MNPRARSCLLAGAVGDAWGGPFEGRPPRPDPAWPDRPALSDDTLLTLATCEAIAADGGRVVAAHVADRLRAWFEAGRLTGLGSATLKALRDLAAGAHWALAGARGEHAAGAGAAMRAAPLAFVLDPDTFGGRQLLRDVCRITHHSDEAYAGALALVLAVRRCAAGEGVPAGLLASVAAELPDTAVRDRLTLVARDDGSAASVAALGTSGHVVDVVPLALAVAARSDGTVEDAVRTAVALGGDTDTVAALAGQVVGAAGAEVPARYLEDLGAADGLVALVEGFARSV